MPKFTNPYFSMASDVELTCIDMSMQAAVPDAVLPLLIITLPLVTLVGRTQAVRLSGDASSGVEDVTLMNELEVPLKVVIGLRSEYVSDDKQKRKGKMRCNTFRTHKYRILE